MMTAIKICGITCNADAHEAIADGAKFIGLIFADRSPRKISEEKACDIIAQFKGSAQFVGIFEDAALDLINEFAARLTLDLVQCHGAESPEYCSRIRVPVIKAFVLHNTWYDNARFDSPQRKQQQHELFEFVELFKHSVKYFLFDRPKKFPQEEWLPYAVDVLKEANGFLPEYFFAGGLTERNVGKVIEELRPFGVDVASGVEKSPGVKDHAKIALFCETVRAAQSIRRR